jgi:hypothetical protein
MMKAPIIAATTPVTFVASHAVASPLNATVNAIAKP